MRPNPPTRLEDDMKRLIKIKGRDSKMRPEYDFSKGVRGRHAARYASGTNVVVLAPDVATQFRTADDVNDTAKSGREIDRTSQKPQQPPDTLASTLWVLLTFLSRDIADGWPR